MKTRILYTKIYTDSYFLSLNQKERFLFVFLLTNDLIGLTPYYEISTQVITLCTSIKNKDWQKIKEKFSNDKKFIFHKSWIYVINYEKYQSYKGEKNEIAYNRELNLIPKDIIKYFDDTVSIQYHSVNDTPINHKSKIINQKSNKGVVKGMEILDDPEFIKQLKDKFSGKNVELEIERMKDWLLSKGKIQKDYAAFARNWLRNTRNTFIDESLEVIKVR